MEAALAQSFPGHARSVRRSIRKSISRGRAGGRRRPSGGGRSAERLIHINRPRARPSAPEKRLPRRDHQGHGRGQRRSRNPNLRIVESRPTQDSAAQDFMLSLGASRQHGVAEFFGGIAMKTIVSVLVALSVLALVAAPANAGFRMTLVALLRACV